MQTKRVIISSRQHALVQLCRSLHRGKGRRDSGLFLVEGRNAVAAALSSEFPLREVLATPDEEELSGRAEDLGLRVHRVEPQILAYAGEAQTSLSVIALGEIPAPRELIFPAVTLILDGVSDPGNVGTLWRAADAAGMGGVLGVGGADVWSPKVVRSAAGSSFHLPPLSSRENTPAATLAALGAQDIPIICAQAHGGQSCFDFEWPARAALVLGHETRGLSPEFERVGTGVTIPIFGRAESLNVAMAGTVLLFAWAQFRAKMGRVTRGQEPRY